MPPAGSGEATPSPGRPADGHVIPWRPATSPTDEAGPAAGGPVAGLEVFVRLTELGLEGWRSLPSLVLACRRVILWEPPLCRLEQLRTWEPTLPSPRDLVALLRRGDVQILARDEWLNGEDADDGRADPGRRSEVHDELLEILRLDVHHGVTGPAARVRRAPSALNLVEALDEYCTPEVNLDRMHREALATLPGYVETAARLGDSRLSAISLLRQVQDRGESFLFSGADRTIERPVDRIAVSLALSSFEPEAESLAMALPPAVNPQHLECAIRTAIDFVRRDANRSSRATSAEDDGERREGVGALRAWIRGCDALVERGIGQRLDEMADRLLRSLFVDPVSQDGAGVATMTALQKVAFVGSVGFGLASHIAGSSDAYFSLSQFPVKRFVSTLKRLAQLPATFIGRRWPYYVIEGSLNPFREAREATVDRLLAGVNA
jgi:hypothetical protein